MLITKQEQNKAQQNDVNIIWYVMYIKLWWLFYLIDFQP